MAPLFIRSPVGAPWNPKLYVYTSCKENWKPIIYQIREWAIEQVIVFCSELFDCGWQIVYLVCGQIRNSFVSIARNYQMEQQPTNQDFQSRFFLF